MSGLVREVLEVAYHRNGVAGEGFHVVKFTTDDTGILRTMVAVLFAESSEDETDSDLYWGPEPGEFYNPRCAVLDADLVGKGDIGFGSNSWRGDHFANDLLAAVNAWRRERYAWLAPKEVN